MSSLRRRVRRSPHHREERKAWGRSYKRSQKSIITQAERGGEQKGKSGLLKNAGLVAAAAFAKLFGKK